MRIKVTVTQELNNELWGADIAYYNGGAQAVVELLHEDIGAFLEDAEWVVELPDDNKNEASDQKLNKALDVIRFYAGKSKSESRRIIAQDAGEKARQFLKNIE